MNNSNLIIRESRIFFEERVSFRREFYLKMCVDKMIIKFNNFSWNAACERWENAQEHVIPYPNNNQLVELQVYYFESSVVPVVVGEANINIQQVTYHLNQEIKIPLTYDGLLVGYLYFEIATTSHPQLKEKQILYIHKINLTFLDDQPLQTFHMRILKNNEKVYEKQFQLNQKCKNHFPSLKIPIKMSDVFVIVITNSKTNIREIKFLVDHIKRGKTSFYGVWIRNLHKNKIGQFKMEYFLDNIFLENERQIFTRNGLVPSFIQNGNSGIKQIKKYEHTSKSSIKEMKLNSSLKLGGDVRNRMIKLKNTVSIDTQLQLRYTNKKNKPLIKFKEKKGEEKQNQCTINSIKTLVYFQN